MNPPLVLEPSEVAYAAEAACGPPYRLNPIIVLEPRFEASAPVLAGLWREFFRRWAPMWSD